MSLSALSQTNPGRRAAAPGIAWLVALLVACAPAPPPATPAAPAAAVAVPASGGALLADGRLMALEWRPATADARLSEAEARARALRLAPGAAGATRVEAAAGRLTVGGEAPFITGRPVWLVTFVGAAFAPEGCACHGDAPSTAVALDAATGEVVLVYGVTTPAT